MSNTFRIKERIIEPNLGNSSNIPVGVIVPWLGDNPPNGWLLCNGELISKEKYPDLYSVIGDKCGVSDIEDLFYLPNPQGLFLRGYDPHQLYDKEYRVLGSIQKDSIKSHTHMVDAAYNTEIANFKDASHFVTGKIENAEENKKEIDCTGETETRPYNMCVNYIIKV